MLLPVYFLYVPRENKLKDDSSNDVDWVRDQRFILIDAQKYYVLDAPSCYLLSTALVFPWRGKGDAEK